MARKVRYYCNLVPIVSSLCVYMCISRWGRLVATHPSLQREDKVNVLRQLLRGNSFILKFILEGLWWSFISLYISAIKLGCDSNSKGWCVPNQIGYYRAIKGISEAANIELMAKELDKGCQVLPLHHHHMQLSNNYHSLIRLFWSRMIWDSS
jgi:hypothetical protein